MNNWFFNHFALFMLVAPFLFFIPSTLISNYLYKKYKKHGIFYHFWQNIACSLYCKYLIGYLVAFLLTLTMIHTRADSYIQILFQTKNPFGQKFNFFVIIVGNFWHLILGFSLYGVGKFKKLSSLTKAANASIQALLSNFLVVNTLKILTGRKPPLHPGNTRISLFQRTDNPADFSFDFWNHEFISGRFMWPSGHTASVFAFTAALVAYYYPKYKWIAIIGYSIGIFTGLAMIDGDFHWASDVVGGAIIGHIIGWVVGTKFRSTHEN